MHDIVVVGAGPGGIAAAVTAAEAGRDVALIDESPRAGGQIWRHTDRAALDRTARSWLARLDNAKVTRMHGTTVIDATRDGGDFALTTTQVADPLAPARVVRARTVVVATGARELFLPFPGWTLPGVVGVGGAQALLKAGAGVRGHRVVIAGSGPLLLPVAAALSSAGARVTHILEQAPPSNVRVFAAGLWRTPARAADAMRYRMQCIGARYITGAWVTHAHGAGAVERVTVARQNGTRFDVACDMLCAGFGLVPSTEFATLLGCATEQGVVVVDDRQATTIPCVYAVGESCGVKGSAAAIAEGMIAALAVAAETPDTNAVRMRNRERAFAARMHSAFSLRSELRSLPRADTIVCRCEDVTAEAIAACNSVREATLHTRAGMGPCQGRVCGPAMSFLYGWTERSTRPPVMPAAIGALTTKTTA